MGRWDDSGTWVGEELRREAFFFAAGDDELYGSVYAPASPGPAPLGVVICNSWGYEGNLAGRIVHPLSIAVARAGGIALNFHYPGFGDSSGEAEKTTVDAMAAAALAAADEAARRYPGARWTLVGLMLGASVAALATNRGASAESLLLVQPALLPGAYFARLERASRRALGGPAPKPATGFAYGYPLSTAAIDAAHAADPEVRQALAAFPGEGAVVRHEKPTAVEGLPARFEQVTVPGVWRFGSPKTGPALAGGAAKWLRPRARAAEAAA